MKRCCAVRPDDAINIQFTSGTTGFPKGATLTHCNILNNGFIIGEAMKLTARDRLCVPVPLYHCFGMVLGMAGSHCPIEVMKRVVGDMHMAQPACRPPQYLRPAVAGTAKSHM